MASQAMTMQTMIARLNWRQAAGPVLIIMILAMMVLPLPPLLLDPAAVEVTLGQGALADELRTLGLPERPADLAMWGESLAATFQVPRPVSGS